VYIFIPPKSVHFYTAVDNNPPFAENPEKERDFPRIPLGIMYSEMNDNGYGKTWLSLSSFMLQRANQWIFLLLPNF